MTTSTMLGDVILDSNRPGSDENPEYATFKDVLQARHLGKCLACRVCSVSLQEGQGLL